MDSTVYLQRVLEQIPVDKSQTLEDQRFRRLGYGGGDRWRSILPIVWYPMPAGNRLASKTM